MGLRVRPLAASIAAPIDAVAQRLPVGEPEAERDPESVALVERLRVSVTLAVGDKEVVRDRVKEPVGEVVELTLVVIVALSERLVDELTEGLEEEEGQPESVLLGERLRVKDTLVEEDMVPLHVMVRVGVLTEVEVACSRRGAAAAVLQSKKRANAISI